MPTYTFINNDTGEEFEEFMSMSSYDQYMIDNPHISRLYTTAPALVGDSVSLGIRKTDGGFNDLMQRIGQANRGSHVAEKYHQRSAKEVKTDNVVNKHKVIQGLQSARAALKRNDK